MIKLLRQYNQWILVVGGTLLLIAFLMPTTLQGIAERSAASSKVYATYADGSLTGGDRDIAQQELRVIENLSPQRLGRRILAALGADKSADHWWLLAYQAQKAGLVGGPGEARAEIAESAAMPPEGMSAMSPEQLLRTIASQTGTTDDVVLAALTKLRGVERMINMSIGIDRISDRRLKESMARAMLSVSGDMVILDARSNSTIPSTAPTEAALDAQLKKFADKERPSAEMIGMDQFGYRTPDRVKAEWMMISKADVAASVANSPELATLALKKRFAQNPARYGGASDGSNFSAFEATVRTAVTDELVKARVDEISKFATDQLAIAQRSLKRDGSYLAVGADWAGQMPSFQGIAQSIASEFSVPAPSYQSSGEAWLSVNDFIALPGIATARTEKFGRPVQAGQLVAMAKELSNPNGSMPLQVNIASPALTAVNGDVYFLRLLAAEKSAPATDLASARANVEADLLAIDRFNWLSQNAAAIATDAASGGVKAVADKYGAAVEFAKDITEANPMFVSFGRIGGGLPKLNDDPKAIAAVMAQAAKIPFATDLATVPVAQRTIAVPIPEKLCMVVLQVSAMKPVTEERYAELAGGIMTPQGGGIMNIATDPSNQMDPKDLFGFEALKTRFDFKSLLNDDETVATEGGTPAGAAS